MRKIIIFMVALAAGYFYNHAEETPDVASIQYWLDNHHSDATVIPLAEFDVDCSSLTPGMHILHYRVSDTNGRHSPLYEHGFYKVAVNEKAAKVESLQYWWDDMESNAVTAPYSEQEFVLSTDALPFGLHSLKYRVRDDAGKWSRLHTSYFYKGEALDSARIVSYAYWWNDLKEKKTIKEVETPGATFELDEDFIVPAEAKTGYAGHYTATLNIAVTDNRGRSILFSSDIAYPDNDAPVTDIDADQYVATSSVKLTWTESTGDKMKDYNVYFSKDGGPFLLWLPDTRLTSATFKGEPGSVYVFTVTGRDEFGNREEYDETKCVSVTFE